MEFQLHREDSSGDWNSRIGPSTPGAVKGVLHHRDPQTDATAPRLAVSRSFFCWPQKFQRYKSLSCPTFFLGLLSVNAPCQILSRPAAVQLIARVESMGVSIVPNNEHDRAANGLEDDQQQLAIKTSWAVPPNYTRLSLVESPLTDREDDYARRLTSARYATNNATRERLAQVATSVLCQVLQDYLSR